jgi:hypothetical protein
MLIFKHYQIVSKEFKCLLQWWAKHEAMFCVVGFLVRQILRIARSQIEIQKIFSLIGIHTNLKRCRLQSKKLTRLIFVKKNGQMILELIANHLPIWWSSLKRI